MGNLGNHMIQYMTALFLARRVPGARLSRIHLPEWGIQCAPIQAGEVPTEIIKTPLVPIDSLAHRLVVGEIDRVDIRTYAQHTSNFGPPEQYRDVFVSPPVKGTGDGELLCNIRQGDVLDGRHPDYVLLPADFYADIASQTRLVPVFHGQLDSSRYVDLLRRRFPSSRFLPSQGAIADFAFIRSSRHIVPSISTFSWLAAWLSNAESIHLPVVGLFNPAQSRSSNLLPFTDARYHFFHFPFHYAVAEPYCEFTHASIQRLWRPLSPDALKSILARTPPFRDKKAAIANYDERFYLEKYPDIAKAVLEGHFPSGRHHFVDFGFDEERVACHVDFAWYCTTYPIAALEMALGEAWDPNDHWLRLGKSRGYKRRGAF